MEFCKQCRKFVGKLKEIIQKEKAKLSLAEAGKEGKSKVHPVKQVSRIKNMSLFDEEGIG